mgnify:CR=1 FL=1
MLLKKISLGLAQADPKYGFGSSQKDSFYNLINFGLKNGINCIDTSPNYLNSDKYISKLDSNSFKLSSKIPITNVTNEKLGTFLDENINKILKRNKIKKIENLFFYDVLLPLNEKRWKIYLKKINELKEDNLVNKIGFSVYNKNEVKNIIKVFTPDILQFPYNVFDQSFNDINFLKDLKKKKITLQARSIFLQGILCNAKINSNFSVWKPKIFKWQKFLTKHHLKPNIACADFVFQNKFIDNYIFGFRNILELKEIIKFSSSYTNENIDYSEFNSNDKYLVDPRLWSNFKDKNFRSKFKEYKDNKSKILFGGMLLSKRVDQFIPGKWPNFFKKAHGSIIKDGNKNYLDFSLMGVGTNILGYSNKIINSRVKKIIDQGNTTTINSKYHLILSKMLIKMNDWSSKCFFAKTGAEANAIALRISRCYNQKNKVAICGYHGWKDWYLSTNIKKSNNLDHIHLPGLDTLGIPNEYKDMVHPFFYNDIKSLEKIIKEEKDIGTIFMEVQRNIAPKKNFLKKIRKIADEHNIVLIFDECSSGFRENYGGIYKKYEIVPDIVVYGKAIANGYPLTAILGKEKVMLSAKNSFISSTFWTDNLGAVAAIETLKEMKRIKSWLKIKKIGKQIKKFWLKNSIKYNLKIEISGLDAMPSFNFKSIKNEYYRTFITQEMLKKNILATNTVYCCINHEKYLNIYFIEMGKLFKKIGDFEKNENILDFIDSPIISKGFGRLN